MLQSVFYEGAGLGGYAWILPLAFFLTLVGGLYAYFSKEKKGALGKLGTAVEALSGNTYKLLAYTAGIAVFIYIMSQMPAIPYVNIITGLALYLMLALDITAWIASVFRE